MARRVDACLLVPHLVKMIFNAQAAHAPVSQILKGVCLAIAGSPLIVAEWSLRWGFASAVQIFLNRNAERGRLGVFEGGQGLGALTGIPFFIKAGRHIQCFAGVGSGGISLSFSGPLNLPYFCV